MMDSRITGWCVQHHSHMGAIGRVANAMCDHKKIMEHFKPGAIGTDCDFRNAVLVIEVKE